MTWKELLIGIPLALIGALLLLVTAAGMMFTRTSWGREQVRSYALEKLNGAIQGRVEIDEVLEGDLLRMVRMAGVRVYEPDGREFLRADTLSVHYRWADFLIGNVTLAKVTIVGPVVQFRVEPEVGWNFLRVFAGTGGESQTDKEPGRSRRVVLREVTIRSGDISLRTAWEPDRGIDPDSVRWHLEETDAGWERVIRLERLNATFPNARVAGPADLGRLFQITTFSTRATIIGEPVEIEQLRVDIEVVHDTLSFQVWQAELPDSHIFGQGWVTLRSRPDYEFTLRGNPVTTEDLVWLIPQLPPGVAHLDFHFLSYQDQMVLEAQNARWESPEATASGDFAMTRSAGPNGLRFNDVDLQVDRVETSLIESLTAWESPLTAVLSGDVRLDGALSALQVRGDVLIEPDGAEAAASHVVAAGLVHATNDSLGARNLDVELDRLQLDLVRVFVPGLTVLGEVSGTVGLNGRLAEGLSVNLDIEHRDRDFVPTRISDGGTITKRSGTPWRLDVDLSVEPISLSTISEYFPAIPLRGTFGGQILARGPLDDLQLGARLTGVSDSLVIDGRLLLAEDRPRYEARVEGWRMRLPEFRRGVPASDIDFLVRFRGEGASFADMEGHGEAHVFASFVGGVQFDSASAALRVTEGRLVVDTSVASGEFGELRASGALSLLEQTSDSLRFELDADSLGALNAWFFTDIEALATPGRLTPTGAAAEAGPSNVEGRASVQGWLVRDSGRFVLRGAANGDSLTYGGFSADSFRIEQFDLGPDDSILRARGDLVAYGAALAGLHVDELRLAGEHAGNRTHVEFVLAKESASLSGTLWSDWAPEKRWLGFAALTARLGESVWELRDPIMFRYEEGERFAIGDLELLSSSGQVVLDGFVSDSGPIALRTRMTGVELADVATLWQDTAVIRGLVEIEAELTGTVRSPTLQGRYEVVDGRVLNVDFSRLGGTFGYDGRDLAVDASMWQGEAQMASLRGTLPLDLSLPGFSMDWAERSLDLTLDGDSVPLVLARIVTEQITDVGGYGRGLVAFGGTPDDLRLSGSAEVADGRFRVIRSGIRYAGLGGRLTFDGKTVRLHEVAFTSVEGGRGTASGTVTFTALTNPEFDLTVNAQTLPVYDRLDARGVVSGVVRLRGAYEAPILTGNLSVVSGVLYVEEIGRQREIVDPFASERSLLAETFGLGSEARRSENPFMENLNMDLGLNVAQDTWLRSADMNIEIEGDLTVQMRPGQEEWRIDGTLAAVRGDYRLFNKRFEVVEGTIDYVGTGLNPGLRIVSLYTVRTEKQQIVIRLLIGGTLEEMTLSLESDHRPPIPESDLLSYLLFGRPTYELTRTGAERSLINDVTSGVPQAFVGYALSSLLVGEAGIAYVDVSRVTPSATEEGEYRSGVGPALAATQVEVGWYLAPTVFISVAQHLVGAVRPTVRLDWRLDDNLTLRGITEPRFGREGVLFYGGPGSSDLEQSIGVFLFYGWSY